MRFPICKVCMKNDILCSKCSEIVKERGIKEKELKNFRRLSKLLKGYNILKNIGIERVIDHKNIMVIITDKESTSKLIGKGGGMAKKLSKDLNKKVRIIGQPFDEKNFIREVFFSVPIIGINTIYSPKGKRYKIRIPASEMVLLPIPPDEFIKLTKEFLNIDVEFSFE